MKRGPLITLSICIGLPIVMAFGLGWYANRAGMLSISVKEHSPYGDDVQIRVPGWFIQPAMDLIPAGVLGSMDSDSRQWLPLAESVINQIDRCPDAVFVTVDSREEHVRIEKKKGHLIINVESPEESVNVKVPASLAKSALRMVARAAAHSHHGHFHSDGDDDRGADRL